MKRIVIIAMVGCWATPSAPPPREAEPPPPKVEKEVEEREDTFGSVTVPATRVPRMQACQGAPLRVGVLGIESLPVGGVMDPSSMTVAQDLTAHLRRCAVPVAGSEKELVDEKLMNNCASMNASCMASIGKNLNVDHLMSGTLVRQGQQFDVELVLLDVKQQTQKRWTGTTSAALVDIEALARAGHQALFGSSRDCGC